MLTSSLQLLTIPDDYKKTGAVPRGAIAYIAVQTSTPEELPVKSGKEKVSFDVLSSRCFSSGDVARDADIIIQELEIIKKQAKKFFQKEKEKLKK